MAAHEKEKELMKTSCRGIQVSILTGQRSAEVAWCRLDGGRGVLIQWTALMRP